MAFFFTPPTQTERRGTHPLFGRLKVSQGISVLKEGGFFRQTLDPSSEEVRDADRAYLGGRRYPVSPSEAFDLIEAGYGDGVVEVVSVYGRGLYGVGPYGA